jgi:hypothetical protein
MASLSENQFDDFKYEKSSIKHLEKKLAKLMKKQKEMKKEYKKLMKEHKKWIEKIEQMIEERKSDKKLVHRSPCTIELLFPFSTPKKQKRSEPVCPGAPIKKRKIFVNMSLKK